MEIRMLRCRYCGEYFEPQPTVRREGKKLRTYVECPCCGNGIDREYRPYDRRGRHGKEGHGQRA